MWGLVVFFLNIFNEFFNSKALNNNGEDNYNIGNSENWCLVYIFGK